MKTGNGMGWRMGMAILAVLGLQMNQANAAAHARESIAAVRNGKDPRELKEDEAGRFAAAFGQGARRGSGMPPHIWGQTRACAQMVRKSRMRRLGIKGSRI